MATGAPGTNGVWQYGEDDSEATFSALLNKAAGTTDTQIGLDRARLTTLEARSLSGFVLVKSQTVGTAVSSVNVTGAFSSTYENYKIVYSGGTGSTNGYVYLKLGATATGYYGGLYGANYSDGSITLGSTNNGTSWTYAGAFNTTWAMMDIDLLSPFSAKRTMLSGQHVANTAGRGYAGYLDNTTSYTDFTFITNTGTITGGTISVYGMKN